MINEYSIPETIARKLNFTNEFVINNPSCFIFMVWFLVDECGYLNINSYKSFCEYKGKDYSILYNDSLIRDLTLWQPAVLIKNKSKTVEYKIKVLIEVCAEKLIVRVLNIDYQVLEEKDFPRPLMFK